MKPIVDQVVPNFFPMRYPINPNKMLDKANFTPKVMAWIVFLILHLFSFYIIYLISFLSYIVSMYKISIMSDVNEIKRMRQYILPIVLFTITLCITSTTPNEESASQRDIPKVM